MTSSKALLLIDGGANDGKVPKSADGNLVGIARMTKSVVAELKMTSHPLPASGFASENQGRLGLGNHLQFRDHGLGHPGDPHQVAVGGLGTLPSLAPPATSSRALELVTVSGRTMISQCFQMGRSTSLVVSQAWEVISSM